MTAKKPYISVLMPVYNNEKFVSDAIESVLNQDVESLEIIIGDDCSSDNTWNIVQLYANKYHNKIVAFRNGTNLGITGNCNKLLSLAKGKYLAFLAGDDLYLPGKLKTQLSVFESDPDCVVCYHDVEVFDSNTGKTIRYWNSGPKSFPARQGRCKHVASWLIKEGAFMSAVSVMVKKDSIPQNGFDYRVPVASDWLFWIEVCINSHGSCRFLDGIYARYRKHANSITTRPLLYREDPYVTLALIESRYPLFSRDVKKGRGKCYYQNGVYEILCGRYKSGRRYLVNGAFLYSAPAKWIVWWLYSWYKQLLSKNIF